MLQVIDNWLPTTLVQSLQQLCDAHGALRQNQLENQLFSWRPDHGAPRSAHAPEQQAVMERTISANFCALSSPHGAPPRLAWNGGATPTMTSTGTSIKMRPNTGAVVIRAASPLHRVLPPRELRRW